RRHTRSTRDWSSDVCSSDLVQGENIPEAVLRALAQNEGRRLSDLARAIRRPAAQLGGVVQELVSIDVLRRGEDGALWFVDPVFQIGRASCRERVNREVAPRE